MNNSGSVPMHSPAPFSPESIVLFELSWTHLSQQRHWVHRDTHQVLCICVDTYIKGLTRRGWWFDAVCSVIRRKTCAAVLMGCTVSWGYFGVLAIMITAKYTECSLFNNIIRESEMFLCWHLQVRVDSGITELQWPFFFATDRGWVGNPPKWKAVPYML